MKPGHSLFSWVPQPYLEVKVNGRRSWRHRLQLVQCLRKHLATRIELLSLTSLFPSFRTYCKPFLPSVTFRAVDLHVVLFHPRFFCRSECSYTNYTNLAVSVSFVINEFCVHTLTYCTEHNPSWEANWFSACQEIPRILWNPKIHYSIHKCPSPASILSQIDPVHTLTFRFLTERSVPARGFLCGWFVTWYAFTVRRC